MLIIGLFYSEASLLSVNYFANYMNVQKDKDEKSTRHSSKGIPVLSEYAKSLERRAKEIYSLWLSERQSVKVLKSLNDRQCDIFSPNFKERKEPIQFKLSFVD